MPLAVAAHEERQLSGRGRVLELIAFAPFMLLWAVVVTLMLPVTCLALPAQYVLRRGSAAHCDFVFALVILAAIQAAALLAVLLYTLWP